MPWKSSVLIFIVGLFVFPFGISVRAEKILQFDAFYEVDLSGFVKSREVIVYDFENEYRHGIFREIPLIKINESGEKYRLRIDQISVNDEAETPYKFEEIRENDKLRLKIGDENRTITGVNKYVINYRIAGGLSYFSDHDEFFWNVTGHGWDAPILSAHASILLPEAIPPASIGGVCYTVADGSSDSNCSVSTNARGIEYSLRPGFSLSSREGLVIAARFDRNVVAVLEPEKVEDFWTTSAGRIVGVIIGIGLFILGLVWYVALPLWVVWRWYWYGRDPRPMIGEASAWFSVPKRNDGSNMSPAELGALYDEVVDDRDVMSTLVDLARRGYLRIHAGKGREVKFEKLKKIDSQLLEYESDLMQGLFEAGDMVTPMASSLFTTVTNVKTKLYDRLVELDLFPTNPNNQRGKYQLLAFLGLMTGNFPLALSGLIFGSAMPRKTLTGSQNAVIAKSLRAFLTSQEQYLEGMGKAALVFEKLLPYAVAFGVEKEWAKRFHHLTIPNPSWYVGDSRVFTTQSLVRSLNSSMHSFSRAAATTTRSSSGFSTGFSGGTSGAGGGGGGGSW